MSKALTPIVIMDFSGIYKEESFYKNRKTTWIDCTDIEHCRYLCDEEAQTKIKERIKGPRSGGIHFIDSGNFHYVSKFWTDKINEPFVLIVFDHHPDMQPTLFGDLMSCGCWVKDAIDTNRNLQKVIIIGAADALVRQVPVEYKNKVLFFTESAMKQASSWEQFTKLTIHHPVYLSIDKDVLDSEEAITDWDNGSMTLDELKQLLDIIIHHDIVLGIDICGECTNTLNIITKPNTLVMNDKSNKTILSHLLNMKKKGEELFPLVDEEGNVIGSAPRKRCHDGSKPLHPVVHLHLFDNQGRLFLQKRSITKDIQPGKWDTSVGGHVDFGEAVESALRREAREELGITEYVPKLIDKYIFESEIERELVHVFTTVYDGDVQIDNDELEDGGFFTIQQINKMIDNHEVTPNFASEYKKYYHMINTQE